MQRLRGSDPRTAAAVWHGVCNASYFMRKTTQLLLPAALVLLAGPLAPRTAIAAEVRAGERVHITAEVSLDGDLYAAGREVVIDGVVRGDVIAAGTSVVVHGRVEGSVMAVGGSVLIDGKVARAARLAGGQVRVNGEVGADALLACGTCRLGEASRVGVDALVSGGEIDLSGAVARGLRVAGEKVRLAGTTGGDAQVRAGTLHITPSVSMASLVYGARETPSLPAGVRIGRIEHRTEWAMSRPSRFGGDLAAALMALVTGLVLLWLLPKQAAALQQRIEQRPGAALLYGAALALAGPLAIILAMITVVALPLAMGAVACYTGGMYLGFLGSAALLGQTLLRQAKRPTTPLRSFVFGLAVLSLLRLIPVLGVLVNLTATLAGLGGLCLLFIESRWVSERRRSRPTAEPQERSADGT